MDFPLPYLLATGCAAGVWMLVLALRLPIVHACLGLMLAVACLGPEYAKWELGPISASPDRLAFMLLIGLAALKRLITRQPKLAFDRSDILLAALLALIGVSIMTSPAPVHTNPRTPAPSYIFLTSYLSPAVLYWIARYRGATDGDLRAILGFFVVFGLYLTFIAICEEHGISALIFPTYILQTRLHYEGRSVGPFLSAPAMGTWITVASVSLALLWMRAKGISRAALLGLFTLFAYAEYLTETRSAWIGFVVAIPLAILMSARRAMRHVVIVGLILVGLVGGLFAGERFLLPERKEGAMLVAHSTYQRLGLLQRSLSLFAQRPLFGWGFGQFEYASSVYGGGGPLQIVSSDASESLASHNVFLRFLAELGLAGCSLQIFFLSTWIGNVRVILRRAAPDSPQRFLAILFATALFAYVAEGMFHDVTFIPQDNMLIFFLAGSMGLLQQEARAVARRDLEPLGSRRLAIQPIT